MSDSLTYLGAAHSSVFEDLYRRYKQNPDSVDESWRKFFEGFDFALALYGEDAAPVPEKLHKEFQVVQLINGYRFRGHLFTKTNPVRTRRQYLPTLDIENFGLSSEDLNTVFQAGELIGVGPATLAEIVAHLKRMYCQSIGTEYMYIRDPERVKWIQSKIEVKEEPRYSTKEKLKFFDMLAKTVVFEQFLQQKFVGQKRFSIEGGEVLIPALERLVEKAIPAEVSEFVFGMAHRGRLNTIAHILEKPYQEIFDEFHGKSYDDEGRFDGDVKYHLGYNKTIKTESGKKIRLTLCPNPSHLEAVSPVAEGLSRSKIDHLVKEEGKLIPIIIHGDAAIAGQGVVYEVIQMAGLDGYRTGGTVHIVVNNQVGFTTNYLDGRTSTYCTDVGKVTLSPVFHVNADDLEAVIRVVDIAVEYRQKFNMDIFIDLLGYRKYGHNEGDEPKFTQPKLYKAIASHPTLLDIYTKKLIEENVISKEYAEKRIQEIKNRLEHDFNLSKASANAVIENFLQEEWRGFSVPSFEDFQKLIPTGVPKKKLVELGRRVFSLPEDLQFFRKVVKLMKERLNRVEQGSLDWGTAETLAYASLLVEGHAVRISGQDVERGTFSHRHAVLKTIDDEQEYVPLNHLSVDQAPFYIYNSLLSEYGVVGFEFGYAYGTPMGLTVWEAQFGDFFNGAQIIIDQFISSSMDKWKAMNGLVMYLPHGYEGMGSEHSSARIERFLQLCAEENMHVCQPTTPANFFHLLRLHIKRDFRVPLIIFTPKKLLRYPLAVSPLKELTEGNFRPLYDDLSVKVKEVDTVLFCTGKIYYDLLEEKEKRKKGKNIAVVRLEQLYPLPVNALKSVIRRYSSKARYIWVQEEPLNMGAWSYFALHYDLTPVEVIARPMSGSPAAGSYELYEKRRKKLFDSIFAYAK